MTVTTRCSGHAPPEFLQLAGHPLRWQLLGELARSDRTVHELTGLVGEPQNLVSYHLGKLRDAGLVSARRSSADGRDTYYTVDLTRVGELLSATGGALHPGLRLTPPSAWQRRARHGDGAVPVHGQQRSVADGRGAGPGAFRRSGRGLQRRQPSQAAAPQRGAGDAGRARHRPHRSRVEAPERVRRPALRLGDQPVRPGPRGVPRVPRRPETVHWSIPDPAAGHADDEASYPAFQQTAAELETRIGFLLAVLTNAHTRVLTTRRSHDRTE